MNHTIMFKAPWGTPLKLMTTFALLILVGIPLAGLFAGPRGNAVWIIAMIIMPLTMLAGAAFFMIRGYTLDSDTLLVYRLGWNSTIDLSYLISATADPEAMAKSIRTCGNGGLFCFAGSFHNKTLGSYRAFATDLKKAVVLRFTDRVIVVTPDDPDQFVAEIRTLKGL